MALSRIPHYTRFCHYFSNLPPAVSMISISILNFKLVKEIFREPNVVAVGTALLGPMTQIQSKSLDIRSISQIMVHEKFTKPFFYKNIGMVHINPSIVVSPNLLPICFPFVASVLDVIHFKGYTARTLGFKVPG